MTSQDDSYQKLVVATKGEHYNIQDARGRGLSTGPCEKSITCFGILKIHQKLNGLENMLYQKKIQKNSFGQKSGILRHRSAKTTFGCELASFLYLGFLRYNQFTCCLRVASS